MLMSATLTALNMQRSATSSFAQQMTTINAYYRTFPSISISLPVGAIHPIAGSFEKLGAIDLTSKMKALAQIDQAKQNFQAALYQGSTQFKNAVNAALQALYRNPTSSDFDSQLDQEGNDAKASFGRAMDKYIGELKCAGHNYPDVQAQALQHAHKAGNFVSSMVQSVKDFIAGLINQVVEWVQAAIDWLETAFATVARWVSNVIDDISNLF